MAEFDDFANDYETALQQGLSVSGEDASFFAETRIDLLSRTLRELDNAPDLARKP